MSRCVHEHCQKVSEDYNSKCAKNKNKNPERERAHAQTVAKLPLRSHLPTCWWTPAVAAGTLAAGPAGRWLPWSCWRGNEGHGGEVGYKHGRQVWNEMVMENNTNAVVHSLGKQQYRSSGDMTAACEGIFLFWRCGDELWPLQMQRRDGRQLKRGRAEAALLYISKSATSCNASQGTATDQPRVCVHTPNCTS